MFKIKDSIEGEKEGGISPAKKLLMLSQGTGKIASDFSDITYYLDDCEDFDFMSEYYGAKNSFKYRCEYKSYKFDRFGKMAKTLPFSIMHKYPIPINMQGSFSESYLK